MIWGAVRKEKIYPSPVSCLFLCPVSRVCGCAEEGGGMSPPFRGWRSSGGVQHRRARRLPLLRPGSFPNHPLFLRRLLQAVSFSACLLATTRPLPGVCLLSPPCAFSEPQNLPAERATVTPVFHCILPPPQDKRTIYFSTYIYFRETKSKTSKPSSPGWASGGVTTLAAVCGSWCPLPSLPGGFRGP